MCPMCAALYIVSWWIHVVVGTGTMTIVPHGHEVLVISLFVQPRAGVSAAPLQDLCAPCLRPPCIHVDQISGTHMLIHGSKLWSHSHAASVAHYCF
jgi:hypothetical protein